MALSTGDVNMNGIVEKVVLCGPATSPARLRESGFVGSTRVISSPT